MNRKQGTPRPRKGFTLAELLIVVAIIAVLVAIAIPIFTSQLEKSRESVDLSNVRAAYAEVMSAAITDDGTAQYGGAVIKQADGTFQATVSPLKQQQDGWAVGDSSLEIGGVRSDDAAHWIGTPTAGGSCTVIYKPTPGEVIIDWGGTGGSGGEGTDTPGGNTGGGTAGTASALGSAIKEILGRNGKVTVKVDKDGNLTFVHQGNGNSNQIDSDTEQTIINQLKAKGILSEDGKVTPDPDHPNGYTIKIHGNNGNGTAGITITDLPAQP